MTQLEKQKFNINKFRKYVSIATLIFIIISLAFVRMKFLFFKENLPINPLELQILEIKKQKLTVETKLPARISSYNIAEIRPQVTGIVTKKLFEEGGFIEKGEQLYEIEPRPYQASYQISAANLKKAKANLTSLKNQFTRYEKLIKIDAVSEQDYENVKAAFIQAESEVEIAEAENLQAEIELDYTKLYAPISGYIGKSNITPGALVVQNQADYLALITQNDQIYVDLIQPKDEMIEKEYFDKARVFLYYGENEKLYMHEGKLKFYENIVQEDTGSIGIRSIFPNTEGELLPGMFVKAKIVTETDAIIIPQKYTMRDLEGNLNIWLLQEDETVKSKIIKEESGLDGNWIISEGLEEGQMIVIENIYNLVENMKIKPLLSAI